MWQNPAQESFSKESDECINNTEWLRSSTYRGFQFYILRLWPKCCRIVACHVARASAILLNLIQWDKQTRWLKINLTPREVLWKTYLGWIYLGRWPRPQWVILLCHMQLQRVRSGIVQECPQPLPVDEKLQMHFLKSKNFILRTALCRVYFVFGMHEL